MSFVPLRVLDLAVVLPSLLLWLPLVVSFHKLMNNERGDNWLDLFMNEVYFSSWDIFRGMRYCYNELEDNDN